MKRTTDNGTVDMTDDKWLKCSNCGSDNLHHYKVDYYDTYENHKTTSKKITISNSEVEVKEWEKPTEHLGYEINPNGDWDNPSEYRSGIRVYFWCECCNKITSLNIAQHQGLSVLSTSVWEPINLCEYQQIDTRS